MRKGLLEQDVDEGRAVEILHEQTHGKEQCGKNVGLTATLKHNV